MSTTAAQTSSPHSSLGAPKATASCTAGWERSTESISSGEICGVKEEVTECKKGAWNAE